MDSLPVKTRLKAGQIVVEQTVCGVLFSFPAAVWPRAARQQREWVERMTPFWEMSAPDWTPQAHRLREACVQAINELTAPRSENREPLTDRDSSLSLHPCPSVSIRG